MGNDFVVILLSNSLKLEMKQTVSLFLWIMNIGAAHSELFFRFKTLIFTNLLIFTSNLKMGQFKKIVCTFLCKKSGFSYVLE